MTRDFFYAAAERHSRKVYTFASYLLGDAGEAEDVTQEVLIKLWKGGRDVEPERLGAWLLTVTRNAIGAMQDQDPRIKDLVSNLTRVRVQVGSLAAPDPALVADRIGDAVAQLEAKGWARIISVEDGSERVYVYSIDAGDGMIAASCR